MFIKVKSKKTMVLKEYEKDYTATIMDPFTKEEMEHVFHDTTPAKETTIYEEFLINSMYIRYLRQFNDVYSICFDSRDASKNVVDVYITKEEYERVKKELENNAL